MGLLKANTSYLGIDIGSNGVKIVELAKKEGKPTLLNFGFSEDMNHQENDWINDPKKVAKIITKICSDSGISSKNVISALPTFSVFSSIISLPDVSKKDLEPAIQWEAKKVIPLPLEEMILDWKKIEDANVKINKYLLTGAPKVLVKGYLDTFREAEMNLLSLETETFSLIRSLLGNDKSSIMIVEIGASTTDVSVIENSIPIFSRSIDLGGNTITKSIGDHLGIGLERAEQFKYDLGVSSDEAQKDVVPQAIIKTITSVVNEIKYANSMYENKSGKSIDKIVLSGGSVLLPGLVNYLIKILNKNVMIGDPWAHVVCPDDLKPLLNEIGARMSVAVGLALRNIY